MWEIKPKLVHVGSKRITATPSRSTFLVLGTKSIPMAGEKDAMKQESPTHLPSPYSYLVLTIDAERNKRGKETSDVFLLFPLCFAQVVRWLVGKRNLAPWVQTRRYGIRHRYNSTSNCGLCDNATRCIVEYLNTRMANSTLVSPIFISRKAHTKKIPPSPSYPFLPLIAPSLSHGGKSPRQKRGDHRLPSEKKPFLP